MSIFRSLAGEPEVLRLIPSLRAISLGMRLRMQTLPDVCYRIRSAEEDAEAGRDLLHCAGTESAAKLAQGVRAAVDLLGRALATFS